MRQTNVRGSLSLRGFRKLRTGAIVATGVILLGLGFLAPTVSASEQDGVWVARTVEEVKADLQKEGDLFKYVIKWGDTLSVISEASNIPVDVLQEMNQASGKNLFLPHNELYFTEAETVSDTVTKHKIVIKESGASGEVRTYEVLLKKDQETKAVTFELTDITEKVEKMTVNYSSVYQPVSAPVVERAEELGEKPASEAPAVTSPEVKEETEAPVAPKETAPEVVTPAPKEEKPATPATKVEEPATPAPKVEEPATPAPKVEEPASSAPKAEEPVTPAPKEEKPATPAPKAEEPATPAPKVEEPATPAPKVEEPATPAPKVEEPATPAPKSEEPVSPAPKVEEPAAPAPKAEEPAAPAPKVEEPATPAPKVEEPATPAPKAEEPATPAPKVEEPATPAPKVEEPATPAPKVEEPATPAPKVEEPATPAPKVEEPATPAPKVEEPATPAPKSEEPATQASEVEEPVSPAPKVEEPATPAPKAEESASPAPKVEEPATPAPKSEEPASTTPKVEESASPAPKVEEPATPAPKVEEPATPAPKTEAPASSAPKAEESAVPAPKVGESVSPAPVTPSEETPVASGESNSTTQPAGEIGKSETTAEPSNTPSADATNESGNSESSSSVTDDTTSNVETTEQPETSAPKTEAPAPKVDDPATPAPKADDPAAPAPKNDESGSSVESPSTGNHSDESGAPSTTPTGDSTATQPSDSTSSPVTPSEEAPVTSGETNSTEQPSGESGKSETTSESSNTPSAETTNDSGNAATSTPTPEASTSEPKSEEELKKEEALKSAKKESIDDNIGEVVKIKADAIEKVTDADEKARLKEALKALQDKAIEEINKAKDDEEVATVTEKYQNEINALDVPGEEVSSPNYGREGLTNNGPGGTTIDNGSTAIGHGASGTSRSAVASPTQPSSTSERGSSFRNAPSVQARARRVARSTSEPDGTVNISYNFAGMPDIHGFLSDPGEDNTVTIPAGTSEAQAKELVKEKIQAKIKDLATRGYHVKNDIIFEQDTTVKNYNYVVTFTKEATGTSGFRMAPAVQPRASRNRRSLEQPASQKVKVNVFYNFDKMKDIAGFLGDINGTPLEIAEGSTDDQVKAAVKNQVDAKKEELRKHGYTVKEDYLYKNNGKDYNYVVTFTKEATGTSGFRMAPAVQPRASRNRRSLEQPAPQKVKVNVFYNFDQMKDIAGFLGDINGTSLEIAEGLSNEQVKAAVKSQIDAKKEELSERGYTFKEDYVYQANGKDYNYVVTFSKAAK